MTDDPESRTARSLVDWTRETLRPDCIIVGLPTELPDAWIPALQATAWIAGKGRPSATSGDLDDAIENVRGATALR